MHLLKDIEFSFYRNLKHAKLEGLRDFNVIIGPNNCGKTNLLYGVMLLSRIEIGKIASSFSCKQCDMAFAEIPAVLSASGMLGEREGYLSMPQAKVTYTFDINEVSSVVSSILEKEKKLLQYPRISNHFRKELEKRQVVLKEKPDLTLVAEHGSILLDEEIGQRIFKRILLCPEARLQAYKAQSFGDFIRTKDLATTDQAELIRFVRELIDPKIVDVRQSLNLVRMFEEGSFDTSIEEQGSGVKSLICLATDILSEKDARMVLVDEPELGLNPSAKHAFLKFLLEQSNNKQVLVATHDPTFVNPILWTSGNTSLFLFSLASDEFVKVNLLESREDPGTFAGYLPHTTSLKQVHIYVEGPLDVYTFQIFLDRYVKGNFDKWYQILNKVGIYHLAGSFWTHLLYTVPRKPYSSIIVLDGDRKQLANNVLEKYSSIEKGRFQLFDSAMEIKKKYSEKEVSMPCPVVCLKRQEIEDYLDPKPPEKEMGPLVAKEMKYVPEEIAEIFEVTLWLAKISQEARKNGNMESQERKGDSTI